MLTRRAEAEPEAKPTLQRAKCEAALHPQRVLVNHLPKTAKQAQPPNPNPRRHARSMVLNPNGEQAGTRTIDAGQRQAVAGKERVNSDRLRINGDLAQWPIGATKGAIAEDGNACAG